MNTIGGGAHLNKLSESNILKLYQFELDTLEKYYLDNYFHYFGYSYLTIGYPTNLYNGRKYWNYIQLEVIGSIKIIQ